MNRAEKTKELLRRTFREPADQSGASPMDERILSEASTSMKQAVAASGRTNRSFLWRTIMKNRKTQFATAAMIALAVILSITLFSQFNSPAWAIEQSIEVLDRFRAVSVEGWESQRTWVENGTTS